MVNKAEFIKGVAARAGLTQKDAAVVVDAVLAELTANLAAKNPVQFVGFGTFVVKEHAERTGRNPATGEEMVIPAKTAVSLKPGKALADAVNGK